MKKFYPVVIVFVILTLVFFLIRGTLKPLNIDGDFILSANVLLFVLTWFSFWLQSRHIHSPSIHAFIRGVYGSVLVKMLFIIAALFIFIVASGNKINTGAVLISMGIYIIYSSLEVYQLMKMVKKK